jgi:hypothetical protein
VVDAEYPQAFDAHRLPARREQIEGITHAVVLIVSLLIDDAIPGLGVHADARPVDQTLKILRGHGGVRVQVVRHYVVLVAWWNAGPNLAASVLRLERIDGGKEHVFHPRRFGGGVLLVAGIRRQWILLPVDDVFGR